MVATNLIINNSRIEQVSKYKYLVTVLNESNDQTQKIKTWVELARTALIKMKNFFKNICEISKTFRHS